MIASFINKEVRCPLSVNFITKVISKAARFEPKLIGEIEIIVVGDRAMCALNRQYRNKDKVTDVLSFAWQEDKKIKGSMLGQIYICYSQIVRQAKEYKVSVRQEFVRMLVHGMLHLVGYDHMRPSDAKKMFALQEKIIFTVLK